MTAFTIAFIDNDFGDFMAAKDALRAVLPRGVDIEGVFDYESAIERLRFFEQMEDAPSVGVYVVDAKLVEGSMSDIIRRIKGSTRFRHVPIVVYTSTDDEVAKKACLSAGAVKLIPKGVEGHAELTEFIRALLPKAG